MPKKPELHFQPQVTSTLQGPNIHRYVPHGAYCIPHSAVGCVSCHNHNYPHAMNPWASAGCTCQVNVNGMGGINVTCQVHANVGGGPVFLGPLPPGIIGWPGPGRGIVQHGHRGGGNIIINNGPTAAGGHILQGAGVGGFGVGYPNHQSGLGGYGILNGQLYHVHGHGYPGGTRFLQPPGVVVGGIGGPMAIGAIGGGGYGGATAPLWNGRQWVTHGPSTSAHLLNMKAKADRKPQELVPADGDVARMYEVQELDGNWTRRNRFTIDSGDIGPIRWFQRPDGSFFAKRLPTG